MTVIVGTQLNNLPKEWVLFFSPNMEFEAKHTLGREFVKTYLQFKRGACLFVTYSKNIYSDAY